MARRYIQLNRLLGAWCASNEIEGVVPCSPTETDIHNSELDSQWLNCILEPLS